MRNLYLILLPVLFSMLAFQTAKAQDTGDIEGIILESGTEEPLFGANAFILGTSKGAAANLEGRFQIRSVPAGDYVLRVSYLGYQTIEEDITVTAGETLELIFELLAAGVVGDEVTITSQRRGQVAAINEQLTSNTIANIVSKDRIQEMPDVNAAESIGRLPGIAIQRSGGEANKVLIRGLSPKFSTVTVNGVRIPSTGGDDRSVDLSLISSNMLDGIEVKKANTPDMDADAIAGSVDLKLREAPEGLLFDLQGQGGYNQLQDYYGNYKISGTVSNRFLDNKLGVIATFNTDNYDRSADQLSAGYGRYQVPGSNDVGVILNNVGAQERQILRQRTGGSLVLDYRLQNGKVSANTFYSGLSSEGTVRSNNILGGRNGSTLSINEGTTSTFTSALSIKQDFDWIQYDAGVSMTSSLDDSPRNYFIEFRTEAEEEFLDDDRPRDVLGLQPYDILQWYHPDDTLAVLGATNISSVRREETNYTAQFNATIPFEFGTEIDGYVKTGFKVRWMNKMNDEEVIGNNWAYWQWQFDQETGEPNGNSSTVLKCISDMLGTVNGYNFYEDRVINDEEIDFKLVSSLPGFFFNRNYDRDNFLTREGSGGFPIGISADPDDVIAFINAAEQCNGTSSQPTFIPNPQASRGNDYTGEERYDAAYIMAEIDLGKYITFIPGVRWEHDYSRYQTERFDVVSVNNRNMVGNVDTLDVTRNFNFIMPMVHLQINPTDWLKFRLARTEALARPDFTQYIPRVNKFGRPARINANNSNLKPAQSINYDASASVYQNHVGLFTASAFHKTIKDLPLWKRSSLSTVDSLPNADVLNIPDDWLQNVQDVTTYINSPFDTKVWGLEFDWQTSFWYLPSFLEGLVLNINYTRMFSETSYQTTIFSHNECISNCGTPFQELKSVYKDTLRTGYRAIDQPAHLANITLGYDLKGFSIRLSYLYQGDRLTNVPSATEPVRDAYSDTYERWDLTMKQTIDIANTNLEIFANLSNLTSTPDRNLVGGSGGDQSLGFGSTTFVQYYGFTMDAGVRIRF